MRNVYWTTSHDSGRSGADRRRFDLPFSGKYWGEPSSNALFRRQVRKHVERRSGNRWLPSSGGPRKIDIHRLRHREQ